MFMKFYEITDKKNNLRQISYIIKSVKPQNIKFSDTEYITGFIVFT